MWNKYIFSILTGISETIFADNRICIYHRIGPNRCIFDMCAAVYDSILPQYNITSDKCAWINF